LHSTFMISVYRDHELISYGTPGPVGSSDVRRRPQPSNITCIPANNPNVTSYKLGDSLDCASPRSIRVSHRQATNHTKRTTSGVNMAV